MTELQRAIYFDFQNACLRENVQVMLSGSCALMMQGFKVRRPPEDIDIYVGRLNFSKPKEYKRVDTNNNFMGSDTDEGQEWQRVTYIQSKDDGLFETGIKIDLFENKRSDYKFKSKDLVNVEGIQCLHWEEIIRFKMNYAIVGDSHSRFKHRDDLLHFLITNHKP